MSANQTNLNRGKENSRQHSRKAIAPLNGEIVAGERKSDKRFFKKCQSKEKQA
jgi:hypothetical protein